MTDQTTSEHHEQTSLWMQRSVSQLLFSYLPGKTVDWEDGVAIVQLGGVRLASAWAPVQARIILNEIGEYLERWRSAGGKVHPSFPNPMEQPERFTIGEPQSINATFLDVALRCLSCSRLIFLSKGQLAATRSDGAKPFRCPSCGHPTLRQFPQIFVHGCGHLVALAKWMPTVKHENDTLQTTHYPLLCQKCGAQAIPEIPSRSERARDLRVICRTCKEITVSRLSARCHECVANPLESPPPTTGEEHKKEPTPIDRIVMRITSYRASEAYYGHTLTILRLDRPQNTTEVDDEVQLLRELLPADQNQEPTTTQASALSMLTSRLLEAQARGDKQAYNQLVEQIANVAKNTTPLAQMSPPQGRLQHPGPTLVRAITESLALKTTVRTTPYTTLLSRDHQGATAGLLPHLQQAHQQLGLQPIRLVDDLPVITTTFGYTRRSFEPTYEENEALLPTQIRPFYALDNFAAKSIGRPAARGTIPILAREGDHEGIFLGLDQERVVSWLRANGMALPESDQPPFVALLQALELDPPGEPSDRYYDRIWKRAILRYVVGLIHSLSHAAMRVMSRFAGLERTSISEYLFLPLLGTVIYANNSTFKMGCMETMLRSSLYEFLETLSDEAMTCLIDPDCIDHRGACAGCLHSPEVSCRVFNHGLSRAFLVGGHTPWVDASVNTRITGYWEM
jgi:hypothetical protein